MTTRRAVLLSGGAVAAAGALAACGSSGGEASTSPPAPTSSSGGKGMSLGPASEVPVGGGKVYESQQVIVTQPAAGQFHCFSAVCPHQGCLVGGVAEGLIVCACHGSAFSVETLSLIHI